MAGALCGLLAARALVGQVSVSMAMTAFRLEVDAVSVLVGLVGILVIIVIGSAPALIRLARLPVADALRQLDFSTPFERKCSDGMHPKMRLVLGAVALSSLVACGGNDNAANGSRESSVTIPESAWSASPLADAKPAGEVRRDVQDGESVVAKGRVKDFVDGRAVFTLIDMSLKSCREMEGDTCPTPWDYCCVEPNAIAENTVTVEFQDASGRPLKSGVKGFHGLDHLHVVTVEGRAKKSADGNVTIAVTALNRQ